MGLIGESSDRATKVSARAPGGTARDAISGRPLVNRRRIVVVAIVVMALVVGYLILRGTGFLTGPSGPAKLEHVHGIGLNPADNSVYAGTHHGLFRLPDRGSPIRVSDSAQDFMGFTVVGPNHFLASGHPQEGSLTPSSLGLTESTDGGSSWNSLSMAGEADFHALQVRHGRVYGYNSLSGALMVSADKKTWETRTTLPMADFAVSPTDPNVLVATTEQGLLRSDDGGRSFTQTSAPLLLLISWADDGTLVGVTPKGVLQVSSDQGATWEQRGTVKGSPEALEAASSAGIYVAADGAVMTSTDGGQTFTALRAA